MEKFLRGRLGWREWPWCWLCLPYLANAHGRGIMSQGCSAAVGGAEMSSSAKTRSQPPQDLLHSSCLSLCQVAAWIVAE